VSLDISPGSSHSVTKGVGLYRNVLGKDYTIAKVAWHIGMIYVQSNFFPNTATTRYTISMCRKCFSAISYTNIRRGNTF